MTDDRPEGDAEVHRPTIRRLTAEMRTEPSLLMRSLRTVFREQGLDPDRVAIADLVPMSGRMAGPGTRESHCVVIATDDDHAFAGHLVITRPDAAALRSWWEVPSEPITDRHDLIVRINDNRRAKRPWNDGLPTWVERPQDLLYNDLIQVARSVLAQP